MTGYEEETALDGFEEGPGGALDVQVVFAKEVGQAGDGAGDFGVSIVHKGDATIDGSGDGEVLIGDSPKDGGADGSFGLGLIEAGNFSIAVEDKAKTVAGAGFAKVLGDAGGAPEGSDIGVGDEQNLLRQIGDQASRAIEAGRGVDDDEVEYASHHVEEASVIGGGGFDSSGSVGAG